MIQFILNNQTIETESPKGMTVLDFVRYQKHLTGTKIGCREGDCGACTVLVGELMGNKTLSYRSMTSCLLPLANIENKHLVTIEGINQETGLTPVQRFMVEESGTQCGFCTVGFVVSMTGFALQNDVPTEGEAIAAIDGNICRCTGYKSIERAAKRLTAFLHQKDAQQTTWDFAIDNQLVPTYFEEIESRLAALTPAHKPQIDDPIVVGGGTDLYVQKHDDMPHTASEHLFNAPILRGVKLENGWFEIGASATVSDLKAAPEMNKTFPFLQKYLKFVSSTPIRNMATIAGNIVNASPIGDLTVFLLALKASVFLENRADSDTELFGRIEGAGREVALQDFFKGYKTLAKTPNEIVTKIRFPQPEGVYHFNFEKVSKRTHLDIASVNSAIFLKIQEDTILEAHVSIGGVAPIPLYLSKTSKFLIGKKASDTEGWLSEANTMMQTEISPISDVRGSADYKRLLAKQLLRAHFNSLT
jgi:xanthine dehydrogenase small subunit